MKNNHFIYNKIIYIILIPFLFCIPFFILLFLNGIRSGGAFYAPLICALLFTLIILLFYKIQVLLTCEELIITFGIGLINKRINLSEIDINSFGYKKIPWYYGIGWRYDLKGNLLLNATSGVALTFKTANNTVFMIVTNDNEKLKKNIIALKEPQ